MRGWSVREVAATVGVSEQAVRKALASGRLTGERGPDGAWNVAPEVARRWEAERQRPSGARTPAPRTVKTPVANPAASMLAVDALRSLTKSHEELLNVVRDLTDEIERLSRANYDAAGPSAEARTTA